jgi:HAD superfamily hydrolase (TIGR01509 family)
MDRHVILFDWDGTLADNYDVIKNGINRVFGHFSMPQWSDEDAKKNIRLTARDLYNSLFTNPDDVDTALKIYLSYVEDNHLDIVKPIDGAGDFIRKLHDAGHVLGIVSNKTQRFLDREVQKLGWQGMFDVVIGAGTAKHDKPQPDSINLALETLKVSAQQAVYVGDTETDMVAAKNAMVKSVFVTYGLGNADDLKKTVFTAQMPIICNNYNELYEALTL